MNKADKDVQEQLYDPKKIKTNTKTKTKINITGIPLGWFKAMYQGIMKRSDVRNPGKHVKDIWARLSPGKKADIKRQEAKGKRWKYDLPLPQDFATKGTGTVRVVKPFDLAEVQVNVSAAAYEKLLRSGLFSKMKRNDGTIALVKRSKSKDGNCNIFIDRR